MDEVRRLDAIVADDGRGPVTTVGNLVLTAKKIAIVVKIPNELLKWHVPAIDDARFEPQDECDEPVIVDQQGK